MKRIIILFGVSLCIIQSCKKPRSVDVPSDLKEYFCVDNIQSWIYDNSITSVTDSIIIESINTDIDNVRECGDIKIYDTKFKVIGYDWAGTTISYINEHIESYCLGDGMSLTDGLFFEVFFESPIEHSGSSYSSAIVNGITYNDVVKLTLDLPQDTTFYCEYFARGIGRIKMLKVEHGDTMIDREIVRYHLK